MPTKLVYKNAQSPGWRSKHVSADESAFYLYNGIVLSHNEECYTHSTDELESLGLPVQLDGAPTMDFYLRK